MEIVESTKDLPEILATTGKVGRGHSTLCTASTQRAQHAPCSHAAVRLCGASMQRAQRACTQRGKNGASLLVAPPPQPPTSFQAGLRRPSRTTAHQRPAPHPPPCNLHPHTLRMRL